MKAAMKPAPAKKASPRRRTTSPTKPLARDGSEFIRLTLDAAGNRPRSDADSTPKGKYAIAFAARAAELIAEDLAPRLKGISATTKRSAGSVSGTKQLDVNFSTPILGLALGISLKSVHIREPKGAKRYTHNKKRNEEELRIEASGYHKRQPYAVMIGVLFLPFDSTTDGRQRGRQQNPSSFGSWVQHLRPYAGRESPDDPWDHFERIYVCLYDPLGSDVAFFDVQSAPPKNGLPPARGPLRGPDGHPRRLLDYGEFLDEVFSTYRQRNPIEFRWASGEEASLEQVGEENEE